MAAKLVKEVNKCSTLWSVYRELHPSGAVEQRSMVSHRGDTGPLNETTCGQRSAAKNLKDTVGEEGHNTNLQKTLPLSSLLIRIWES